MKFKGLWEKLEYYRWEIGISKKRMLSATSLEDEALQRDCEHFQSKVDALLKQIPESDVAERCPSLYIDGTQCMYDKGHKSGDGRRSEIIHNSLNSPSMWSDEGVEDFRKGRQERTPTTKQIGDSQEDELLARLLPIYPKMVKTNINAIGVDLQNTPDIDVQSKASHGVGPKDVSHFADSSEALLKIMVGLSFTPQAKSRALKRSVTLLTLKEFRKRYPLPTETKNVT